MGFCEEKNLQELVQGRQNMSTNIDEMVFANQKQINTPNHA